MNPFEYVKSINFTKENLIVDEATEKGYNPFLVNRSLSYFIDTILYANEMNLSSGLDNKLQYEYYLHGIRKGRRFSKWAKKEKSESINIIAEYYQVSFRKAEEIARILSEEEIEGLRLEKGGRE